MRFEVLSMSSDQDLSECPECGVGVKVQLEPDRDLTLSELTESDVRQGEYFFCPMCQIAWDAEDRTPYDLPMMSSGPSGFLSEITSGKAVSEGKASNYRLLGYSDEGKLMLRNVGDLAFARDSTDGPVHPGKLQNQLGEVVEVEGAGYPKSIQNVLNAIRPGYCVHATIGESEETGELEFAAQKSCEIVEAVPVNYVVETEYVPEFADAVWNEDFDHSQSDDQIPYARRTLHTEDGPAADVYVFPKGLRNEQGVPLLAGIQRGMTPHLEKFTTNFTGVFNGGVIDVIFIAPSERPYFAVYCLGGDCLDLSHELRAELELPVVHRGWDTDREEVYDIRYNPHYVKRAAKHGEDVLIPVNDEDAMINIESGTVDGDYFELNPEPHEVVVAVPDEEKTVEVARLRAPSSRLNDEAKNSKAPPEVNDSAESDGDKSTADPSTNPSDHDTVKELTRQAHSRLVDLVELQPTSNGELADAWGLSSGSEVYQYLSSEFDDYYYRDDDKYIRATDRAEQLIEDTE